MPEMQPIQTRRALSKANITVTHAAIMTAADLAQAKTQADLLYHEETAPRDLAMATDNHAGSMQAALRTFRVETSGLYCGAPLNAF